MNVRRLPLLVAGLVAAFPPMAEAFADPGTKIDRVELPALAGGKIALLSSTARANVLVFVRPDQERSLDALRQLDACEQELAGKGVRWVALVSGSAAPAEVKAAAAATGTRFPVLFDEGDKLYAALQVRMYPAVAIVDGKGVLQAIEPYRQLDFAEVVKGRIRFALGELDRAGLERVLDPAATPLPGGDPTQKAMRDVNMARRLLELGQPEAAAKQAQTALEQAPVPAAFPVLGLAYARLGRCADAKKMIDQGQKVAPGSPELAEARKLCAK